MNSILSFKQYDVIETIYRFNPALDLESEDVTPKLSLKINFNDEKKQSAILMFTIEMGDKELKNNSFYVKAMIAGFFSLEIDEFETETETEAIIKHMYTKNALSILFPYMRSLISDLSSKGNEPPIVLPPMNIAAMVDDKDVSIEEYVFGEKESK